MTSGLVMELGRDFIQNEYSETEKKNKIDFEEFSKFLKVLKFKKKMKKIDYRDTITIDKDIMNGKAVFKGTRILVTITYDFFIEKYSDGTHELKDIICQFKKEYPSLKNKQDKTIIKGLMFCISRKSFITFLK